MTYGELFKKGWHLLIIAINIYFTVAGFMILFGYMDVPDARHIAGIAFLAFALSGNRKDKEKKA